MDTPKTLPEFYQFAMHAIYAVVIGLSFDVSRKVVIPFENIKNYPGAIETGILVLAYFIVVTSWIGYTKSVIKKPHTSGFLGIARFGTDLFIVFIFYYMVSLTDPEKISHKDDIFILVMPAIYLAYCFWDAIKWMEYRHEKITDDEKEHRKRRRKITVNYFVIFFVMGMFYFICISYNLDLVYKGISLRDPFYVAVSILFTGLYRHAKWNERDFKKTRVPRPRRAKTISKKSSERNTI